MKTLYSFSKTLWLILLLSLFSQNTFASHAQSADISYVCLGGNQYQINVSFYRDCAGTNAPNSITVNTSSASCTQNFNVTLHPLAGTGIDITPICAALTTTCNGGTNPGVQEYKYQGILTMPVNCIDWIFSFSLCCRNNAINTINNPGGENIYVEARMNNFDVGCNNSPTFSNPPVSFPCVGQTSCFNHGAFDVDGDSLYYTLVAPATGPNTAVTYIAGYSAQQPLQSNPGVTFNPVNGDICMSPTLQEVTVLAVKVEEYRNGFLIGTVIRDIQLRTVVCNNTIPYLTGINNTGVYTTSVCAGNNLNFTIPSFDVDPGQNVTMNWNNAIPGANFTVNAAQLQTGTFNWTPTTANISNNPYCFTVTVQDDNCPMYGVQIYSFCVTVTGFTTNVSTATANCGASNGSATAFPQGGQAPYSYQWSNGGTNVTANGLSAGNYTVIVTDVNGCSSTTTATVGSGSAPGNLMLSGLNISCFRGNDGALTANVNGGQPPYTYQWSNGGTTPTINNLIAGTYWVTITTNGGCIKTDTVTITEPATPVSSTTTINNVTCFGGNNGNATVTPIGGIVPYTIAWNTTQPQTRVTASNLPAGSYTVIVTDKNGCVHNQSVIINSPSPITIAKVSQQNVSCFGGNNGALTINPTGGTAPYSYNWNNNRIAGTTSINSLTAGTYTLELTDANGCISNAQYPITEPNEISVNIINSTNVSCHGLNDGTVQTSIFGGTQPYTYQWNPSLSTQQNPINLSAGHHTLMLTDNNGCIDSIGVSITEPSAVLTSTSGGDTICPGQAIGLSANATGGSGNYTYQWNNNNTGATQTVSPRSTTTYSVFAKDANGCIGTIDSTIVLVNDISLVNFSTVPNTDLCEGSSYALSATLGGGIGNYSFIWDNGLGQGQGPFIVAPLFTTNYTVTLTDECNNSIQNVVQVVVNPLPKVHISPQTKVSCGEVKLSFNNNLINPIGISYDWDFGDNTFSVLATPEKTFTQSGIYQVRLTLTSAFGCKNNDQAYINVTVNPKPIAQFEVNPLKTSMLNPEATIENYSIGADFYLWSFGDGATSSLSNPIHSYQEDGIYLIKLIATNIHGCKDSSTVKFEVEPEYSFYIPNAFTPDNDGVNDVFSAVGEEIEEFNMLIFNRWGNLIFETNDLTHGWNGNTKGGSEMAMEGVYVYKIKIRDWQGLYHNATGHVSLLR